MEARTESFLVVVAIFKRNVFGQGGGDCCSESEPGNLFCLSYSLSAATPIGPPECTLNTDGNDHLSVEAVQ
jgi:hypothetical protein